MNWEQKGEMCSMLNQEQYAEAIDLVIEHQETMDEQAWDMFYTGMSMLEEDIKPLIDKHKIIRDRNADMKFDSFRTAIRASAYELTVDRILSEQSNPQTKN